MGPAKHLRLHNLVTYASLGAALIAATRTTGPESRHLAGGCLAAASLADTFDGKFARLFPRTEDDSRFGVQIDSLADVVAFGVAPVVVLHTMAPPAAGLMTIAWLAAAVCYVVCSATRLAYYNITQSDQPGFVGVPTTVFGVLWSFYLFFNVTPLVSGLGLLAGAGLMVAPIRIGRPSMALFALLVATCLALVLVHALWR